MDKSKKIVKISLLTSVGIIFSIIEGMIPLPISVPGLKLGLSNIVQLISIVLFGGNASLIIGVLKSILVGIGTGNLMSIMYSLPASILSTFSMIVFYKYFKDKFSLIGISIIGALFHNLGQLLMASIIIDNFIVLYYYPYLAIASVFTGGIIGFISISFLERVGSSKLKI